MIVGVPAETPVTIPVEEPTVASEGLVLLHIPPPDVDKVVVAPSHTIGVPVITGAIFTVSGATAEQPDNNV